MSRRPVLEIIESAVVPNVPFLLDDIEIGHQAARPEGDGWQLVEFLNLTKSNRWARRRPACLPRRRADD